MKEENLEKKILEQKELAKQNIDKCEYFILLTNEDMTGCASMISTCELMVNGFRTMIKENLMPEFLVKEMTELILADDPVKYMKERTEELKKESEEE